MGNLTLEGLVAADCMQRDVLTISPLETLRDALEMMTENHVTGLPVMDAKSRCIGLITATDILNYEQEHSEDDDEQDSFAQHYNPDTDQWESMHPSVFGLEQFGDVRVEEVMTSELISVDRDAPLKDVAQKMLDGRVHRVLVLDESRELFGVVSAIDFVRVIAET